VKKVAVYKDSILPPSETFIRDHVESLASWRPELIGRRLVEGIRPSGVPIRMLKSGLPGPVDQACWRVFQFTGGMPPLFARPIAESGASLIHAHFGHLGVDMWPIAKKLDLPLLVTLHGSDVRIHKDWWSRARGSLRFYPDRLVAMGRDKRVFFVAVSESMRQSALEFGLRPERLIVNFLGIDRTRFEPSATPPSAREPVILFVGRLVEKKGCDILLRAFAQIRADVPEARLRIIGDGPDRPKLADYVREHDLPVAFEGSLPSEAVSRASREARLLCLPSITAANGDAEGLPIVILEAQASGTPVVTSARGGATEGIVDGETGLAFAEGDADALAGHLRRLLRDDAMADAFAAAGPEHIARHFDIRNCSRRLERIYDRIVEHGDLAVD
jgi:glycosyltransferase involved in cell wall biosynthesis